MKGPVQATLHVAMPRDEDARLVLELVRETHPQLAVDVPTLLPRAEIDAGAWSCRSSHLLDFDRLVHGAEDEARESLRMMLSIRGTDPKSTVSAVRQIVRRYQRLFLRWPADIEARRTLRRVLEVHAQMHDLAKPLVRADYDHALDVWQWLLHLHPKANVATQIAALFHDIERLVSEPDVRVEHRAGDYVQFKTAHAWSGGQMLAAALADMGLGQALERAVNLVARHERPDAELELQMLNDADGLSFFSLNSAGFLSYFGQEHTRMKVRYTLARMSRAARNHIGELRLPSTVAALVDSCTSGEVSPSEVRYT